MILKGSQRAGGADLATHLSNQFDNTRVEVAEVRGTVADDLHGAFAEFEAIAAGTECRKPLYSLSISPPSPISREQYRAAIDHIEGKLGLVGQPRAIVFHEKEGREHCHVVWSRVDLDRMKAVQISHDHMKLRTCARELAHAYGLRLPEGLAEDRGDARFEKPPDVTRAEKEMAVASGLEPEQRRAEITALYRASDNAESFRAGLERAGYILAQGDSRAYVVIDRAGDIHALARQIDGVRTKAVKERLASIPAETLPTVDIAKAQQQSRQHAVDERLRERARERGAKSARDLAAKQAARRRKLIDLRRQQLSMTHAAERVMLHAAHKAEQDRVFNRVAGRIFALFDKVPALRSVIAPLRANPTINAAERHRIEDEALNRRHARERRSIDRRSAALDKIEARERRGLIRALVRDTRVEDVQRQARTDQRERDFRTSAVDVTAHTAATPARTAADDRRAEARLRIEQARQREAETMRRMHGRERG